MILKFGHLRCFPFQLFLFRQHIPNCLFILAFQHLHLLCRCIQTVKPDASYQQNTYTVTTIQKWANFSYIGRRWFAYCQWCSVLANVCRSLCPGAQVIKPKCRRFLNVSEPPRISRKNQRCSKCLRKGKNGEMPLQIHMVWVKFHSFPNNCFRPSSCSISGKVQTTSEGSSRHPFLAKEVVPRHPFIPQQPDPASVLSHWGHCLVTPSNQMPNRKFCWPRHELSSKEAFAEAPRPHPMLYFTGTTTCFCHSGCCSMAPVPHWLQGMCPALGHIWITGNLKADPGWGWSPPAKPLFPCEGAGVGQALVACPARVSQCREQLQQLQPTSPLAERPQHWGRKPRCCSW